MAELVLVEGTTTPCVWLPKGRQKVVPYTRAVQRFVDRGYIVIRARGPIPLGGRCA